LKEENYNFEKKLEREEKSRKNEVKMKKRE
jgi:hypothetical protein